MKDVWDCVRMYKKMSELPLPVMKRLKKIAKKEVKDNTGALEYSTICLRAMFTSTRFYFAQNKINYAHGGNGVECYNIKSKKLSEILTWLNKMEKSETHKSFAEKQYTRLLDILSAIVDGCDWTDVYYGKGKDGWENRIHVIWPCICYHGWDLFMCYYDLYQEVERIYPILSKLFEEVDLIVEHDKIAS